MKYENTYIKVNSWKYELKKLKVTLLYNNNLFKAL